MRYVQLPSGYYLEDPIVAAGEAAEILHVRATAYCGQAETQGFVRDGMVARLAPTRARARVQALVDAGLWERVDGGYVLLDWDQDGLDALAARRRADKERQRRKRHRDRAAPGDPPPQPDSSRPMSRDSPRDPPAEAAAASRDGHAVAFRASARARPREELELDAACGSDARAREAPPPLHVPEQDLPGELAILRSKLDAARLVVRWDRLHPDVAAEIADCVRVHGDAALVKSAQHAYRPDSPPVFAQAWLGHWRALPPPGERLRIVTDRCPTHALDLPCRSCAADRKAGSA